MTQMDGSKSDTSKGKSILAPLAGLAAGIALLIFASFLFLYAQLFGPGPTKTTQVSFVHGMSVTAMGRELQRRKVIHSASLFRIAAKFRGRQSDMKAGTYDFPAGISLIGALKQIEEGRVVQTYVTIPEGRTSAQAVRILMATPNLTGDVDVPPEGSILPETYLYEPGEARQAVLERMLEAGRQTLDMLWAKRQPGLPFATKEDALIMASVVERETRIPAERPRVAAVFINRLRSGMRLGSDPTVIYGISHGEPLGRGLTRSELDTPTPWNTYLIDGLPTTPIANPGKASLEATLNPAKTQDLYFVADGSGGHVFSATYEAHLANVAKWRAMEAQVNVYTSSASAQSATSIAPPAAHRNGHK
ncbi:hypothetical protein AEAC466_08540 [Asticcacaulis sp. AC466]|uniref:endolytic transglycosylase MltG n=1 Tax=Asticcacaulis sp. AC466 TaxID=1282362 RepID=UPI0003C40CCE|nr:endolytic transglycosylase MltG [Asticcacaulis sp. AC466]ESQ84392.1 hypothetical protein AEAC466_08540 [Asticcacaulis sp. AC466]